MNKIISCEIQNIPGVTVPPPPPKKIQILPKSRSQNNCETIKC